MRLLDALSARTAPVQMTEERYGMDWYESLYYDGHRYIVGQSGSMPDEVATTLSDRVNLIHNKHGVIAAAVATRALLLSQVRFQWRRRDGSLFGSRELLPLERPGSMTRPEMLTRIEIDVSYCGTAFLALRDGEVFRLDPDKVKFVLGSNSDPTWSGDTLVPPFDTKVTGLIFDPGMSRNGGQGQVESFSLGEFAVWAPEPDPRYPWRGTSWITSVVREMLIDGQVTDHESKFFTKAAVPGLVFMMSPDRSPDEIKAYSDIVNEKFAGVGNAYKNMFLGGATDVKVVGSAMNDLGLGELQGTFENRVAVRSRIPAVVLGTKEALSGSSLNAGNYSAARRMLADGWFSPTVDNLCASLEAIVQPQGGIELGYDPGRVLFLQEDQKDAADITQTNAVAMRQLVEAGFEPASVVEAVKTGDMSKLTHTGNVSVQLQPPGTGNTDAGRSVERSAADHEQLPLFNVYNNVTERQVSMTPTFNVGTPDVHVDNHVAVEPAEVRMEPTVVNVSPTPVTVDNTVNVDPTPVTIENNNRVDVAPAKVPPAQVTVMPSDSDPSTFKVKRDRDGRISEVVED